MEMLYHSMYQSLESSQKTGTGKLHQGRDSPAIITIVYKHVGAYRKDILCRTWGHAPVISATQEAEAGESLEPGRQRLQLAEITPLPPAWTTRMKLHFKKKKKKEKRKKKRWVSAALTPFIHPVTAYPEAK